MNLYWSTGLVFPLLIAFRLEPPVSPQSALDLLAFSVLPPPRYLFIDRLFPMSKVQPVLFTANEQQSAPPSSSSAEEDVVVQTAALSLAPANMIDPSQAGDQQAPDGVKSPANKKFDVNCVLTQPLLPTESLASS